MNKERYRVLSKCLVMVEAMQRRFSRNGAMVEPMPGYEKPWEEEKEDAAVLREMLREARYDEG